jgi:3-phenylpropionate/trans-cinnamate dioxygenase ferredoxin reductase subunit
MRKTCSLVINGQAVKAYVGETLVDAGLGGWVIVPHDCCSGQCDTCRVTVVRGAIDDQGTGEDNTVLACLATVEGDAEITFEDMPAAAKRAGLVTQITSLSPEVLEVVVALDQPLPMRPGQYVAVKFSGFPARDYSPSCRLDGAVDDRELILHIRRLPGGLISTQIGSTIRLGHRVSVRGPFGQAFLREGSGPLVLVAGGTGWAPIWSLARAARQEQRHRDIVVIAGSRDPDNLYMRPALEWLSDDGVREVIATSETGASRPVLPGRPTHYLPSLGLEDTVHVAGPAGLVDAVKSKARAAAARCYADPFLPSAEAPSLADRVMQMLRTPAPARTNGHTLPARPTDGRLGRVLRPLAGIRRGDLAAETPHPAPLPSASQRPA